MAGSFTTQPPPRADLNSFRKSSASHNCLLLFGDVRHLRGAVLHCWETSFQKMLGFFACNSFVLLSDEQHNTNVPSLERGHFTDSILEEPCWRLVLWKKQTLPCR